MGKLNLKPANPAEKKEVKHELPTNVARKYEAVGVPTVQFFPKQNVRIDMRTMSMEEADALFEYSPGRFLKLKKDAAADTSKKA